MNSQKNIDTPVILEEPKITKQKKNRCIKKPKTKLDNDALMIVLDDESYIDINKELTWTKKLTNKQKAFIFYYLYPFKNNNRGKGAESARRAGYSKSSAIVQASQLLADKDIYEEIKNIREQISGNLIKLNLKTKLGEIIERKMQRLNIKPTDFYDIQSIDTESGSYITADIKPKDELSEEQIDMIEDVEFVGQKGIAHYKLPNKREAENELLKILKDLFGEEKEDSDSMEVETTAEIIKGNLQLKTKVIKSNKEITDLSDLKKESTRKNRAEED